MTATNRRSYQQIFNRYRQFPNAYTSCVVHRVSDGGGDPGEPDLTDAACSDLVKLFVGIVEEVYFDCRRIGVHGYEIVRQTAIDRSAVLGIVFRVLQQGHAYAHHHRALDLIAASQCVDDLAGIDDCDYAANAQTRDLRLPSDLGEVAPEGLRRELRL